jgi:hypothetical protein
LETVRTACAIGSRRLLFCFAILWESGAFKS